MASDSDPNVGVGTPIAPAPGVPGTGTRARPLPYTLLSLPRFARILGINPVHFSGAHGNDIWPLMPNRCEDIWPRHSWQQSDHVSHEEILQKIQDAEQEIASYLGYWPAPKWIPNEVHSYPQFHRRDMRAYGGRQFPQIGSNSARKTVQAKWKKVIEAGHRGATLLSTATTVGGTIVYQDLDSDGFYETATITATTTVTDTREIKVFQTGKDGKKEWEIRDPRSVSISGGTVTIVFDSWALVNTDSLSNPPSTAGFTAVNVTTTANFMTEVDVYRIYNDNVTRTSQFFWNPDDCTVCTSCNVTINSGAVVIGAASLTTSNCPVCGLRAQDGCLVPGDVDAGILTPAPGAYNSTTEFYDITDYAVGRDPDLVKVWYRAGELDDDYLTGDSVEPLSDYWAHTIAYLAVSRLDRNMCSCGNVKELANSWRVDIAFTGNDSSFLVNFDMLKSPFGTRRGELTAWARCQKFSARIIDGAVI